MVFSSHEFIFLFLPVVLAVFYLLRGDGRMVWLLAVSMAFYSFGEPSFFPVLLLLTAANYALGAQLQRAPSKAVLILGLSGNVAVLAWYKYAGFLADNLARLVDLPLLGGMAKIALPLGISFFIFQKIAYLVDSYRGRVRNTRLLDFVLFVWFFPQLIAGPIVHYRSLIPQFRRPSALPAAADFYVGLTLFAVGLAKKAVIADTLAQPAAQYLQSLTLGGQPAMFEAWTGVLCYTFQIYFDFSAYSDMALGLARMVGIRLPLNFRSPYQAANIVDFWRRWHMSLSAFLRDYIYVPLGGNRRGPWRRYVNLMVTMLIGGLWHGASWSFVAWGGLHGLYLVVNHAWQRVIPAPRGRGSWLGRLSAHALTFLAVAFAWAFFQAGTLEIAQASARGLLGFNGVVMPGWVLAKLGSLGGLLMESGVRAGAVVQAWTPALAMLPVAAAVAFFAPNVYQVLGATRPHWRSGHRLRHDPAAIKTFRPVFSMAVGLMLALGVAALRKDSPFIYFNF